MSDLVALAKAMIEPPLKAGHTIELGDGGYLTTRLSGAQQAWLRDYLTALRTNVPAARVQQTFDVELQVLRVPARACERTMPEGRPRALASLDERAKFESELASATKEAGGGLVEVLAPRFSAGLLRGVAARIGEPEGAAPPANGCAFSGLMADLGDGRVGMRGELVLQSVDPGATSRTPRSLVVPVVAGILRHGAVAIPGPEVGAARRLVTIITLREVVAEATTAGASRPSRGTASRASDEAKPRK